MTSNTPSPRTRPSSMTGIVASAAARIRPSRQARSSGETRVTGGPFLHSARRSHLAPSWAPYGCRMRRVPIRIKLTLAFTVVMALVLLATGLFLYLRLASEFDRTVNQGLRTRAGDVEALIKQTDTGLGQAGRPTAGQE